MNVVGHNHECMQDVVPKNVGVVMDGFYKHVCDGRLPTVERARAGFIEQSIHCGKCLSGGECARRESSVGRQAVV